MKNRQASCGLDMTLIATIAHVVPNRTKHVLVARDGLFDKAFALHGPLFCDDSLLLS